MTLQIRSAVISSLAIPAFILFTALPARAAAIDESIPDSQTLTQLQQRADQAKPRDQVFLYTELVHTMTELAAKQLSDGEVNQASATLKQIEHYAQLIHINLANDTRRLKNAEMLMEHTTHRLKDYLHSASSEDQPTLQATLTQLDQVHTELLTQVFRH